MNMKTTFSNQTKNRLVAVIFGVLVVFSFIGWEISISPLIHQLELLDNGNKDTLRKAAAVQTESYLEKRLDNYSPALLETKGINWLTEELNRMALQAGLTMVSATPLSEEARGNFNKLTLRIEVRGGYHELVGFAKLVENSSRFIKISNLHVELPDQANDTDPGLKISMSLSIFSPLKKRAVNDTP